MARPLVGTRPMTAGERSRRYAERARAGMARLACIETRVEALAVALERAGEARVARRVRALVAPEGEQ